MRFDPARRRGAACMGVSVVSSATLPAAGDAVHDLVRNDSLVRIDGYGPDHVRPAAAAADTEKLRSALLTSVSHDLKTPLAAILRAVTSVRSLGDRMSEADRVDLLLVDDRLLDPFEAEADMARQRYRASARSSPWL